MVNLNPHLSVDCAIFGYNFETLNILLIQRGVNSITGHPRYAIPGDLIRDDEDLPTAASRILYDLTGLEDIFIQQVGAFGKPDRTQTEEDAGWLASIREEPDARVVTIGYYALINMNGLAIRPASFAEKVFWCPIREVGDLAFDHNDILNSSYELLKSTLKINPVGYNLLPEKFTLKQLQNLYEAILDRKIDKRNFRRKIKKLGILEETNEREKGVAHKPSRYFSFDKKKCYELIDSDFEGFKV